MLRRMSLWLPIYMLDVCAAKEYGSKVDPLMSDVGPTSKSKRVLVSSPSCELA